MMNKQANSTLYDSLFDCFENQDWSSVIEILEISLTKHHYCCQHEDTNTYRGQEQQEEDEEEELEDIFENFLFRVDEQIRTDHMTEETASKIIQLFLSQLTTTSPCSLYAVAQAPMAEDTKKSLVGGEDTDKGSIRYSPTCPTISSTPATEGATVRTATTPLIHNDVCIENKHIALALLLRTLDPTVASREVQTVAHIVFDYEENIINSTPMEVADDAGHTLPQSLYHNFNAYHTPLQAAWAGTLFDEERFNNLDKIHQYDDLTDVQADLWTTTVYLLLAFDEKPISLDFATGGDWNMLPVISRYGPRCYDAVMMVALRLYPHLAQSVAAAVTSHMIEVDGSSGDDADGDYDLLGLDLPDRIFECPLHEACKHQICYRPAAAAAAGGGARLNVPVVVAVTGSGGLDTVEGDQNAHHSPHLSLNRTSGLPVSCVHFPAIMLLKQDQSAAFMLDTCGRLPLHLALMHHRSNWDILAAFASTNESGEKDVNIEEKEDMSEEDEECIAVDGLDDYMIYSVPLIRALVRTNPKALEHAEPSTGLYPFLLAAASNYTSSTSLDMLFFLLNSNPIVAVNNVLH